MLLNNPGLEKKCVVVGTTNLSINCISELREQGWQIQIIVSDDPKVVNWAKEQAIIVRSTSAYTQAPVDTEYLFSIINPWIIPPHVLEKVSELSVNYHDSLLPKYAGANSTSWAILNGEQQHGITWHVIDRNIDLGDIILQESFALTDDETAWSLNLKCTALALSTFKKLIYHIENNSFIFRTQQKNDRTYFALNKNLPNMGVLNFNSTVEAVNRLKRALDFGDFINPIGSFKVALNDNFYIIAKSKVSIKKTRQPAGKILKSDKDHLIIALQDGEIIIEELLQLDGMPIHIDTLNIQVGMQINDVKIQQSKKHDDIFYLDHIRDCNQPLGLYKRSLSQLITNKLNSTVKDPWKLAADIVAFFLSSTLETEYITFYFRLSKMESNEKLYATDLPLSFNISDSLNKSLNQLSNDIKTVLTKYTVLQRDINYRYQLPSNNLNQAILINFSGNEVSSDTEYGLIFNFTTDGFKLISNVQYTSWQVQEMLTGINSLQQQSQVDPVQSLSFLTPVQREEMIYKWNETQYAYSSDKTIKDLFEESVCILPNNIAVSFDNDKINYAELNRRANQLAHHLFSKVKPGQFLLVGLDRSLDLLISMLAIFKLGAVYVPLDPNYPPQRLQFIADDTKASLLLTNTDYAEKFIWFTGEQINLDTNAEIIARSSVENIKMQYQSQDFAYVMYTSGSTGKPKGVINTQQGLVNRLSWSHRFYPITTNDVLLQNAAVGFDIAVWEILFPLLAGARLVIGLPEKTKQPTYLVDIIQREKVSIIHFVPSLLRVFLEAPQSSHCTSIKQVICGGEALTPDLRQKFYHQFKADLYHAYGPTEAAISVTHWNCLEQGPNGSVPIGYAIANTTLYILNSDLKPFPIGSIGELYIGGDALAHGYLHQPTLTADRFIANPFQTAIEKMEGRNARLYKTGDLVRWCAPRTLEYIGRSDFQVKIRGFRIELGEIENVLMSFSGVQQCIVIACGVENANDKSNHYLVAYYVAEKQLAEAEILAYLADRLPDYMLPTVLVYLNKLPLNINGKLDRPALPIPKIASGQNYLAPRNNLEQQLCEIWSGLLAIPVTQIGVEDDFFKLGGNSLSAIRCCSKLSNVCAEYENIASSNIFKYRTIASLAKFLSEENKSNSVWDINKVDRNKKLPLSYAQQRLWFLDQYEGSHNANYNIACAIKINGLLDEKRLIAALQAIIVRHESLRTYFGVEQGEVYQIILPKLTIPIIRKVADESQLQEIMTNISREPFDLSKGPLLRVALIQLKSDQQVLLLNMHHIISDGWSIDIFLKELSVFYNNDSQLPELHIQPADIASWQHTFSKTENYQTQIEYWKRKLSCFSSLVFPADFPRPSIKTYRGKTYRGAFDSHLIQDLQKVAQQNDATLFMVLLTCFKIVLQRYSGQDDVIVGTPIANRNHPGFEPLISLFVNTLALRSNLSANPSFKQLIEIVKETCLEAYANQDLSFEQLVESLNLKRDLSYDPIFQVMFVLEDQTQIMQFTLNNCQTELLEVDTEVAKFDLVFYLVKKNECWNCRIEYNADLFHDSSITRLAMNFSTLLTQVTNDPAQVIHDYPMVTLNESEKMLSEFNNTYKNIDNEKLLQELFVEQVNRTPDAIALVSEKASITYLELDRKSNQIARKLQRTNVQPNSLVAIVMDKSIEQVIAVLGIIKAGAAYLPVSIEEPMDRITKILEQGEVRYILTKNKYTNLIRNNANYTLGIIDEAHFFTTESYEALPSANHYTDLAYVIFTSGSTGTPKGVMITHQSALNTILDINLRFSINEGDKILGLSALNFDLSVYDIFGVLYQGGTLVLPAEDNKKDPRAWLKLMEREKITLWNSVPALLQMLVEYAEGQVLTAAEKNSFRYLRLALLSGDWIPLDLPQRIKKLASEDLTVISLGGATEGSIWSILYPIEQIASDCNSIPYGTPMYNQQFYIRDPYLQLLPIGTMGELCIGGIGVAQGYWRDPVRTAHSFVMDPITQQRIYRTGDMGRYLADGTIEFLGRKDNQVKVRGFRIELGEIENILQQHPAVSQAVVVLHDSEGESNLVAYYVPNNIELTKEELRLYLRQKLPEYMMPVAYIVMTAIPLTANAKVDKKTLLQYFTASQNDTLIPPVSFDEKKLAEIWQTVLGITTISMTDNFFEVGGNSLRAIKILNRIHNCFDCDMGLRDLFEYPILRDQVKCLQKTLRNYHSSTQHLMKRNQQRINAPMSFAQQRLWFLDKYNGENVAHYSIPIAVTLNGELNVNALVKSCQAIVDRHEILRTVFNDTPDGLKQIIYPVNEIQIPIRDVTEDMLEKILKVEVQTPFNLAKDSLIRLRLFRLNFKQHVFTINLHHIVGDGLSIKILLSELEYFYNAYLNEAMISLPALSVQYSDYAVWQHTEQKCLFESQLAYWKIQLKESTSLNLPIDFSRPALKTYHGENFYSEISVEIFEKIKIVMQKENTTLFVFLLTVFKILLRNYSQQDDIIVGTSIANRQNEQLENMIGLFINTLALRSSLSGNPLFIELLEQMKQTCLAAYSNQDVPFEKVIETLELPRDPSRDPIFQVMFVLENDGHLNRLQLEGLTTASMRTPYNIAKYDLTLFATETNKGVMLLWEYNKDLFKKDSIARFAKHFEMLLIAICNDPNSELDKLTILSAEEQQLFQAWNQTTIATKFDKTISQLFTEQVNKTPDAIALAFDNQQMTYRQLDEQSNQVARYIQIEYKKINGLPIKADDLIAVCMPRSCELIISILAILKAGAAYLPVDPEYPAERIAFMLEDSHTQLVLKPEIFARLHEIDNSPVLNINSINDLAYVIYTSGSTGKPKGVLISQKNVINYFQWYRSYSHTNHEDVVDFSSSIAFDLTVTVTLVPLLSGAKIVVCDEITKKDPNLFYQHILKNQITVLKLTPSYFALLAAAADEILLSSKKIILGGEAISLPVVQQWLTNNPSDVIYNEYGPTETTVGVSQYTITSENVGQLATIPIGKPATNSQFYILDKNFHLVPVGIEGELYIGGEGLASGYLNRDDLTADRFVTHTYFGKKIRLYRTGDLARWLANGNVEYLGRMDEQVKVRGYRIELGEIATTLMQHSAIAQAIILVKDTAVARQLVAYFVAKQQVTANELRQYLKNQLPDYMIPDHFIALSEVPLTTNGKLDKQRLPELNLNNLLLGDYIAPQTDLQKKIASVWAKVLQLPEVGLQTSFFNLGGNSLLTVELCKRLQQTLSVTLRVVDIFKYPTVALLAQHLESISTGPSVDVPMTISKKNIQNLFKRNHRVSSTLQDLNEI